MSCVVSLQSGAESNLVKEHQDHLLLRWSNLYPHTDNLLHQFYNMGWIDLCTFYWACHNLSMLWLKWIHVCIRGNDAHLVGYQHCCHIYEIPFRYVYVTKYQNISCLYWPGRQPIVTFRRSADTLLCVHHYNSWKANLIWLWKKKEAMEVRPPH